MNKFIIDTTVSFLQFITQKDNSSFSILWCYDEEKCTKQFQTLMIVWNFPLTQWLIPIPDSVPQTQWEAKKDLLAENNPFI